MSDHRVFVEVLEHTSEDRTCLDELELAEDVRELVLQQSRRVLEAYAPKVRPNHPKVQTDSSESAPYEQALQ